MKNPELLCLGCMEELKCPGDTCRKCGFDRIEYEKNRNVHTLPSYTILAGKYLLGRVLGEGGFGITYIAWDLKRECRVAVKEYFPSGLATRDTRLGDGEALIIMPGEKAAYYRNGLKNFAEEGKNLARFQHLPGIVSVRDFFQDNGTAYIVMDYAEGKNLKQYLREHYEKNGEHAPMEENQILEMMQPLLQALSEIHKAGIIHRDISPENIICGEDGKITLIDFGAARAVTGTETKSLTIMLKHGYAPEEQYRTRGKQGSWTDIYAICATMYQMASGYLPIESVERLYEDELKPLKQLNTGISEKFSDVIEKGMAVRGDKRYQSVEEIYKELYPKPKKRPEAEKVKLATEETQFSYQEKLEKQKIQSTEEKQHDEVKKMKRIKKIISLMLVLLIVFFLQFCCGSENHRSLSQYEDKSAESIENQDSFADIDQIENMLLVDCIQVSQTKGDTAQMSESDIESIRLKDGISMKEWNGEGTIEDYVNLKNISQMPSEGVEREEDINYEQVLSQRVPGMAGGALEWFYLEERTGAECSDKEYAEAFKKYLPKYFEVEDASQNVLKIAGFREPGPLFQNSEAFIGRMEENGYRLIGYQGKFGYADAATGEIVIPLQYSDAGEFSCGLAPVKKDGYYGYIDETGTLVVPAIFASASTLENGMAAVSFYDMESGRMLAGYLDSEGVLCIIFRPGFSTYGNSQTEIKGDTLENIVDPICFLSICAPDGTFLVGCGAEKIGDNCIVGWYTSIDKNGEFVGGWGGPVCSSFLPNGLVMKELFYHENSSSISYIDSKGEKQIHGGELTDGDYQKFWSIFGENN